MEIGERERLFKPVLLLFASVVLLGLGSGALSLEGSSVWAAAPSPLPGGASALQETYQDWRLLCESREQGLRCLLVQRQVDAKTRRRVLAVELELSEQNGLSGAFLLPFGLALGAGVVLQVDDAAPGTPLSFSTCLPAGCLVPLALDEKRIAAMRKGSVVNVRAKRLDGGEITFSLSLKGFSEALNRLAALTTRK